MNKLLNFFAVKHYLSRAKIPSFIASMVGVVIGAAAFMESVEVINDYFEEEQIVFEVQQNTQENHFFMFFLKGFSDKNYSLDTIKFHTDKPAKIKLQYSDLKKPILLDLNPELVNYSYTFSKEKWEQAFGQNIVFESQKRLFVFIEFEEIIKNQLFECEFSGQTLDPDTLNAKLKNVDCTVEEFGYISSKNFIIWIVYLLVAIIVFVPIIWLARRILKKFQPPII
jgi:hypothetical protein